VAWSLHLIEEAFEHREFSLMLAGTLVALAAAMLVVYFLMGNCMSYLMNVSELPYQPVYEMKLDELPNIQA